MGEIIKTEQLEIITQKIIEKKIEMENNIFEIGKLLTEAKENIKHGQWSTWLNDEVKFSQSTATRFMRVYNEFDSNCVATQSLGTDKLFKLLSIPKDNRTEFIDQSHEVNGINKTVDEMTTRELQKVIKEYKNPNGNKKIIEGEKETTLSIIDIPIETDTKKIYTDVCILNNELRNRADSEEDLEVTLVAIYNAKEITHQEFNDTVIQHKFNLPIFFLEKSLTEYLDRFNDDFYSEYEHYDSNADLKEDRTYYSIFDKDLEWQEVIKCWDKKDENAVDWSKNNHVDNKTYQLAECWIETTKYLCIYKNYKLKGTYMDGKWSDIEKLGCYDRRDIPVEDMKELKDLYKKLEKQLKELEERSNERYAKEQEKRNKAQEQKQKYDDVMKLWKEAYQPYSMGRYRFEDIWDEKGNIKNWTTYREMTDFVRTEKQKKQDQYKNYDWDNMFGGGTSIAIKEEDKPNYKRIFRILAKQCHPDIVKDDGTLMQLANKLKEQWGV